MIIGVEGRTLQGERYGVARYLANLLRHMVEIGEGNRYIVYLSESIEPLGFSRLNLEFRVIGHAPSFAWRHLRLPLAMRHDGVDLHFSPSYFLPLVKVCPSVVVVHDITFKVRPEWFAGDRRFLFDGLFWREVRKAEAIITVSENSKRDIVRALEVDPSQITVIPEAADDFFRPVNEERKLDEVRRRYGLGEGFLFTVGAVHTRRNLERLIEAAAESSRRMNVGMELLILGKPAPFSPPVDIEGTTRHCGMEGRVRHVEFVSDEDLLLLYNACGLFVYPSLYEGFGLPVIEAMACGTAVACSNTTSLPEVAGEAAVYFNPKNVGEIADAIERISSDGSFREELEKRSLARASSFSWPRAAEETLEVFAAVGRGG
ncbi:MAG: glycosyltransferase family 1 protein [Actinomycetota bacterium]|nr:glycosyltransferase family 1 protein [Actinomycetota bacterium]